MKPDRDWQIRLAAMEQLEQLRRDGQGVVTSAQLEHGFVFEGERIKYWSRQRGIWRPQQLRQPGAALTLVTAPRVQGRRPAYDDEVAADDKGWFGYRYEGSNPDEWTNVAVRLAGKLDRPLIYLYGITKGLYEPIFPTFVARDEPENLIFRLQADVPLSALSPTRAIDGATARREYATVAVKRRLHQHRFRELVLSAYRRRCTICHLGHVQLLDAAHIIPDHDDRGLPLVSNGLAMCKIHHSAYDANIIGISPDLLVHVRADILEEIDGPMLEHGLKSIDKQRIRTPLSDGLRPNPDFLAARFEHFRAA